MGCAVIYTFNRNQNWCMKFASISQPENKVLLIKYNPVVPNKAEFEEYLDELYTAMASNPWHAQVFDGTEMKRLPSNLLIQHSKWIKDYQSFLANSCPYTAYVVSNPILKPLLRSLLLVQRLQVPYKVVSTLSEGYALVRGHLSSQPFQAIA